MTLYQRLSIEGLAVIIPSYNNQIYLSECIKSVLYHEVVAKVIVVDDGSKDGSLEVAKSIQDDRLQILTHGNNQNLGRSASRNVAIEHITQAWVGFCDSDDYWLPNRFDSFHFEYPQDTDGVYGMVESHFVKEEYKRYYDTDIVGLPVMIEPEELLEYLVVSNHHFSLNSFIVRHEEILKVGSFDTNLVLAEDTDLIWRLAADCSLYGELKSEVTSVRRIHKGSSRLNKTEIMRNRKLLYELWLKGERSSLLTLKSKTLLRIKSSKILNNSI